MPSKTEALFIARKEDPVIALDPEVLGRLTKVTPYRIPPENIRALRPVVLIKDGLVIDSFPGIGYPVVIDLDEFEGRLPKHYYIGLDEAELTGPYPDLDAAMTAAETALEDEGRVRIDLELHDEEGNPFTDERGNVVFYTLWDPELE